MKEQGIEIKVTLEDYKAQSMEGGLYKTYEEGKSLYKNRKDWIKSKYFGSISSMLYNGTYKLGEIPQDFTLKYEENSWCDLIVRKGLEGIYKQWDIYTVSSHAAFSLGRIMIRKNLGNKA